MKVLFLDVDGVLNNDDWAWEMFNKYKIEVYRNNILYQPHLVQLRRIINKTGAKIVVSSSWRKIPSAYEDLKHWLKMYGMEVYSETPYVGGIRGDDIEAWLEKHKDVEEYAILDDDTDMGQCYGHLINTFYMEGLTPEMADRCIKMLGGNASENH